MTEIIRRSRLFVGSYTVLFLVLAVRFEPLWLELLCGGLALLGLLDTLWIVLFVANRTAAEPVRVSRVVDVGAESAGYLATYLLPFLTVSQPGWRDLVAYALFLVVTGVVYVRSEMTQVNPTLYLLGRRIMRVTTDGGWDGYVVVRSSLVEPATVIRAAALNASVRVEVRRIEDK